MVEYGGYSCGSVQFRDRIALRIASQQQPARRVRVEARVVESLHSSDRVCQPVAYYKIVVGAIVASGEARGEHSATDYLQPVGLL